jgi:hypothetical protein
MSNAHFAVHAESCIELEHAIVKAFSVHNALAVLKACITLHHDAAYLRVCFEATTIAAQRM